MFHTSSCTWSCRWRSAAPSEMSQWAKVMLSEWKNRPDQPGSGALCSMLFGSISGTRQAYGAPHPGATSVSPGLSGRRLVAPSQRGADQVPVEGGDGVQADLLGAHCGALADVGAAAEAKLVHGR